MSKTKTRKNKTATKVPLVSIGMQTIPIKEAHDNFAKKHNRGVTNNPTVATFLQIVARARDVGRGILCFTQIIRESKSFELDTERQLRPLWEAYCREMVRLGKMVPIVTIYDEEQFQIVN